MKHKPILLAAVISVMPWVQSAWAGDVPPALVGTIRDTQAKQQQIQNEAQSVIASIDSILAEYKEHGMENRDDVKTLHAIRKVLLTMSADEMKQVIALLQQARNAQNADAALHQSAEVSAAQATIVQQLKQLMALHARQERQYDLATRFQQLAKRQDTNLGDLLDANRANNTQHRADVLHDTLNLQKLQQDQLTADVQTALDDLNTANTPDDSDDGDRIQKAIAEATNDKLSDNVALASSELGASHIFQAATAEKASRDALREMARLLILPTDTLSKLQQSIKDVDQAISDQKQLNDQTQAEGQKLASTKATELEKKQAANVDATDTIRKNLDAVSPKAVDDLNNSIDKMQDARADLNKRRGTDANTKQDAALAQLQQAKQDLTDQAAKLEAQQNTDADNLDKAKSLKEQAEALKKDQIALEQKTQAGLDPAAKTHAQKQQDADHQTALDIQQQALDAAPAAAAPMADAAKAMDAASHELGKSSAGTKEATDQQQLAVAAIDKAIQSMNEAIAKLEQEQKDADAIAKSLQDLAKIIEGQQKVGTQTDAAVALKDDQSVKPIAPVQAKLSADTAALQASLPPTAAEAGAPLGDAKTEMDKSATALAKPSAGESVDPEHQALADLEKARDLLAKKEDQLNQDLGKPQDTTAAADDAAQKLDTAIKETDAANQQMQDDQQTPPAADQPTMADLQKQQQQIASALTQMQQTPQTPAQQAPMQKAQQAADQAAQDLAANQPTQAVQQMQQATQAMQQAQQGDQAPQTPQAPQGQKPEQGAQQAPQPDGGQKADQGKPDQGKPDQGKPEQGKPDQGKPEQGGQDAGKPEQANAGGKPEMGDLIQKQQKLEQEAAALGAQQQAAQQLADAEQQVGQVNANDAGTLPPDAAQALQQAQQQLSQAAAQAAAGNKPAAQAAGQKAAQAMGQAKAAMAMGGAPQPGQPGNMPGQMPGQQPGKTNENMAKAGKGDRKDIGQGANDGGPRGGVASGAEFLGLPQRDRQALQQSRAEKYPEEYAPQVEQYLQNLSDDGDKK